ncbi:MAG: SurA N-terminal domain-containing protein [Candidatus Omnitrophota bacterium]|nr:SurA N-terminal domain-containing protein [Candidatus Omnitrophota bacterium]
MLKAFRKNTKLIIWTVVVSFALWGAFSVGISTRTKAGRWAGEVFGKDVSFQEFDAFYRSAQIFTFGSEGIRDPEVLQQKTWQSVIYAREAKRLIIEVTDDEVRAGLTSILAAQNLKTITPEQYEAWLQRTLRVAPHQFESQLREVIRIQKLIASIMSGPVEDPAEEQLKRRFLLDRNALAYELIPFSTLDEARIFRTEVSTAAAWQSKIAEFQDAIQVKKPTSLNDFINQERITEPDVTALFELSTGEISEPLPRQGQYAVIHILEKQEAPAESWDDTTRQQYLDEWKNEKGFNKFLLWNAELLQRAALKNYIPSSIPPEEDPEENSD